MRRVILALALTCWVGCTSEANSGDGAGGGSEAGGAGGSAGAGGGEAQTPCIETPPTTVLGDYDASFQNSAIDLPNDLISLSGVQLDGQGRILVYGEGTATDQAVWVMRFLPDGAVDTSLAGTGMSRVAMPSQSPLMDIAVDEQGRIYGVGFNQVPGRVPFIFRLTEDGQLDSTFGTDGLVTFPTTTTLNERGVKVLVLDDGIVVLADTWVRKFTELGIQDETFPAMEQSSFSAMTRDGETFVFAENGRVKKLDLASYTSVSGWADGRTGVHSPDDLVALPGQGVAVLDDNDDVLDGKGMPASGYPEPVNLFTAGHAAAYCDGRVLFAGVMDDGTTEYPAAIRGTPNGGFDLGATNEPAFWTDPSIVAPSAVWRYEDVVVQPDGKVIYLAQSDVTRDKMLLLRFSP